MKVQLINNIIANIYICMGYIAHRVIYLFIGYKVDDILIYFIGNKFILHENKSIGILIYILNICNIFVMKII